MFSSREASKKLGLGVKTLSRYIQQGKIPAPQILKVGSASLHAWTEEDIERVRKLLPKIANGRKTRYKKKRGSQPRAAAVPTAKAKTKKKSPPRAVHGSPGSSTVSHRKKK
jgi:predicted DNA-binding transcriptional regulator AlpA